MNYKETVEAKRSAMADQLLDFIENNPTAWEAGWYKVGGAPRNGKTDKAYNGLNALWLYLIAEHKGYTDPRWVTYQQAKDLKASVKAGEKSSNVFYWSWYDKKTKKPFDDATVKDMGKDERQKYLDENVRPVLKYYQVFNAAQCQNFPKLDAEQKEMPADERARQNAKIENIISNSAAPVYYDGGNRAYYSPGRDSIHLPEIHRFHTMQDYYATALHEIAHSTGRKERLNRDMSGAFGSVKYAQEELRAELASVFMQLDLDIRVEGKHFENHGAYLQSWLKRARADKKEFFAAVTDAEKISQYVGEHYLHENEVEAALAAAAEENTKEQEQAATKVIVLEPEEAAEYLRGVEINERRKAADNEIYGLIYDWKGLKEENSLYTGKQLKELDAAFVPEDRYDGAIAANKTYMAIRLTGKTPEQTDQNVRKFLTGKYNEAGDIEYIEGWYWETVEENFFTGEKNETTLKYIDRLNIPSEDLRMKEEYAIEQRQKKIDKIVYDIVNEGTENTTQGNWIINFDQFGEDEVFVRNYIDEIAEALNKREEVADVIINENGIDTDYFTDYCPNIENRGTESYTELVRERVEAEYRDFQTAEMKKPVSEVFANSFKINFYSELHNFLGEDIQDNLTDRDFQALYMDAPHIIGELYNYYLSSDWASIGNYSDIADMIQAYNDENHSEIVADRYNEMPHEQTEQAKQVENTKEKYQLNFRMPYSNTLLLSQDLEKLGYQRDYSIEEANQRRDTAAFEASLPYWTNEIRYIGADGKAIEGVYGRTNNGIMIEAADITRFTTNGLTQDEANQIADVVRGFDVEVDMQQIQREETLDAEEQTLRRDNLDQSQPAEQVGQAEQAGRELTPLQKAQAEAEQRALSENIAYVVIEWSEKNSSALTSALRNNTVMTFDEADKLLDAMNEAEKARDGYYKTKLHIVTPVESEEGISAGWYNDCRYDIGSEPDGGLIAHIKGFAEYASDGKEISEFADVLESHRTARKEQAEQAEQAKQAGQAEPAEWYAIELSADQIGNEYEKSVMIRMPQGEYSSFVFFAPKNLVRDGEKDGTKKLSVRSDWEYRLTNDGLQVELNGSELRAAFAGREVGKSAKRVAPRRRNKQRLSDLEANVPDEMKALKNWCVFRTKYNPETERQEKFVISPTDGKWAKSNDPNTWVDFQTALKYAEENDCAGLSFALDGKCGITCIDLDKSISKDGKLTASAEKLTQELADTYAETSVSGNGIHIFVADDILHKTYKNRADLPDGEIEVYDNVRFISMTGNKRSKSNKLTKCPAATTSWLRGKLGRKSAEYDNKPRNIERQSDSDVIERIRRSKRGRDFDTLMSGGAITGDKSRDDMILLNMLAFFSDCDRSQMEAIFRSSGRSVETGGQGQGKSSNYLARSIDKAVSSLKTRISPAALGGAGRSGGRAR